MPSPPFLRGAGGGAWKRAGFFCVWPRTWTYILTNMAVYINVLFPKLGFTGTWKRNKMGDLSTAGTTVSTVIFRQDNIFVANVGDSTAVLGECHCCFHLQFGWQFTTMLS